MDTGTIIIAAIMLAISILPVILIHRGRRNKEKDLLQSLNNLAEKHNCKISKYETWNNSAIGFDETANMLFFFRRIKDKEITRHIKLSQISKCKILNTNRNVKVSDDNYSILEKIELVFFSGIKGNPDIHLEFYNSALSVQVNGEAQLAERWVKIISDRLMKGVNA